MKKAIMNPHTPPSPPKPPGGGNLPNPPPLPGTGPQPPSVPLPGSIEELHQDPEKLRAFLAKREDVVARLQDLQKYFKYLNDLVIKSLRLVSKIEKAEGVNQSMKKETKKSSKKGK